MGRPIGTSALFLEVLADVKAVAPTNCSVLLSGETGTGKEVIARTIHDGSTRCAGPFVATNCGALPAALLESEMFGHERGAFTGAVGQTSGRFLAAAGGTLFLDEIGELPLELQPKLLRVLQERSFERLGSTRSIHADVRIIAATNRDLQAMVLEGRFRADLFYRLNVFPIVIPSLRMRLNDVEELAHHFVRKFACSHGKRCHTIPEPLLAALKRYSWPGNIRELQNFIERAVIMSDGHELTPRAAEMRTLVDSEMPESFDTLDGAARRHILQALDAVNWVIGGSGGAAARLGIPRTTLIYKMQRLGILKQESLRTPHVAGVSQPQCLGFNGVTV